MSSTRSIFHQSREEAKARGEAIYTGSPCSKCGCTRRYVSNANCFDCCVKRIRPNRCRDYTKAGDAIDGGYYRPKGNTRHMPPGVNYGDANAYPEHRVA